jgi:hypothetical protein
MFITFEKNISGFSVSFKEHDLLRDQRHKLSLNMASSFNSLLGYPIFLKASITIYM